MFTRQYLSQHNKRWTQQISMMFSFFFFFLLTCVFSTSALATVTKNLHFEWQFDTSYPGLAGYKFFKDGVLLVTINNPTALSLDYTVALEENRSTVFTMKTFDIYGNESPSSEPYAILSPADVNHDQNTDLTDLILILQILTNTPTTSTVYSDVDVSGDGRIGMEEAIKCLQIVATI